MRFPPQRSFTIETALPPSEVHARLRAGVEPIKWPRLSPSAVPFEGVVDGMRFDIRRIVRGRNSFRPRVRGTIEPTESGTRLVGTMRLHDLVATFVMMWVAITGLATIMLLFGAFQRGAFEPALLIAPGALAFVAAMTFGAFRSESRRALDDLARLVNASEAELG